MKGAVTSCALLLAVVLSVAYTFVPDEKPQSAPPGEEQRAALSAPPQPTPDPARNEFCPAQKLCDELRRYMSDCRSAPGPACDQFVDTYKQLLPEYGCARDFDGDNTVPAIWKCDDTRAVPFVHEQAIGLLSKLKTARARRLFGSAELRATLDGHIAEEYLHASLKASPRKLVRNSSCPAPALCAKLQTDMVECRKSRSGQPCSRFVEDVRRLMPEYDCARRADEVATVPALWLCRSQQTDLISYEVLKVLAKAKNPEARRLFASKALYRALHLPDMDYKWLREAGR